MEIESRQAALCIIRRKDTFLVAEIRDSQSGLILHRPPGGGIEDGETPERAVRRELQEELGINLTALRPLGALDHIWSWKGRAVRERAWLFLSDSSDDPRLSRGETPELLEANGQHIATVWRPLRHISEPLPPICPSTLPEILRGL